MRRYAADAHAHSLPCSRRRGTDKTPKAFGGRLPAAHHEFQRGSRSGLSENVVGETELASTAGLTEFDCHQRAGAAQRAADDVEKHVLAGRVSVRGVARGTSATGSANPRRSANAARPTAQSRFVVTRA